MRCALIWWSVLLVGTLAAAPAVAENWPAWRGPLGTGVTAETDLLTQWSATENVRWKTPLPDRGNSTPIIWKDRIFLTQAIDDPPRRELLCFDRSGGQLLWQAGTDYAEEESSHQTNPYCSPSAVTDGERVIVWFGSAGLFCYDFDGKQLWQRDLGPQRHQWGHGSSPVLHENLCFLNFGPGEHEFVVAVDKQTGQIVWRAEIPQSAEGEDIGDVGSESLSQDDKERAKSLRGSWSTPLLIDSGERNELIVSLPNRMRAYDPSTGSVLWTCDGLGRLVYSSPMWGDGVLVAMGGWHSPGIAVEPGGSGDVQLTHRLWHKERTKSRLGTGVVKDDLLFLPDTEGIVQCLELRTGKVVWQKRLRTAGSDRGDMWSSLVLSGDSIYALNQSGDVFVFRAAPEYELLATNSIGEPTNASIAVSDGDLFIRTRNHLWCIGPEEMTKSE